jgi:hypothetical protein
MKLYYAVDSFMDSYGKMVYKGTVMFCEYKDLPDGHIRQRKHLWKEVK